MNRKKYVYGQVDLNQEYNALDMAVYLYNMIFHNYLYTMHLEICNNMKVYKIKTKYKKLGFFMYDFIETLSI